MLIPIWRRAGHFRISYFHCAGFFRSGAFLSTGSLRNVGWYSRFLRGAGYFPKWCWGYINYKTPSENQKQNKMTKNKFKYLITITMISAIILFFISSSSLVSVVVLMLLNLYLYFFKILLCITIAPNDGTMQYIIMETHIFFNYRRVQKSSARTVHI